MGSLLILDSFSGCAQPIGFNGHGTDTTLFRDNLIERGNAANATQAVTRSGELKQDGDHIASFCVEERPIKPARRSNTVGVVFASLRQIVLDVPDNNRHFYRAPHRWINVRLIVGVGF